MFKGPGSGERRGLRPQTVWNGASEEEGGRRRLLLTTNKGAREEEEQKEKSGKGQLGGSVLTQCRVKTTFLEENQDGGVGRHTAPPRTARTDRKSNGKEVQHQGNKK